MYIKTPLDIEGIIHLIVHIYYRQLSIIDENRLSSLFLHN